MSKIILIIEDDQGLNQGIMLALKQNEYQFLSAFTLQEGRQQFHEHQVDMVLLDINLPDGSGYTFLEEVRKTSQVPIIMLTANDMEIDEVRGIELGADDYITKPFSLMVLRARVQRLFSRTQENTSSVYEYGDYFFDFTTQRFLSGGESVELSKTEQKLLQLLISRPGQTLTREILNERIWQEGADFVDENSLSVAVGRLRKKLSTKKHAAASDNPIRTVYGIGYVWAAEGGRP